MVDDRADEDTFAVNKPLPCNTCYPSDTTSIYIHCCSVAMDTEPYSPHHKRAKSHMRFFENKKTFSKTKNNLLPLIALHINL